MSNTTYKAVLFAPDGDHVTDFRDNKTKQEVWDEINNMGSRWYFYPLCFVASEKGRVVDVPEGGFDFFKGKNLKTVKRILNKFADELCDALNNGFPVYHIDFESAY